MPYITWQILYIIFVSLYILHYIYSEIEIDKQNTNKQDAKTKIL